ncbi:MAG: phosphate ABC transporter permease PstA [Nitrococcus sp.]|nr:phosphate ABC transporter permease PstA [Nitrococcus sp.]
MPLKDSSNDARLQRRYRAEKRFRLYCGGALLTAIAFLVFFFADIISRGYTAFYTTEVKITLHYTQEAKLRPWLAVQPEPMQPLVSRAVTRIIPRMLEKNPRILGTSETRWVVAPAEVDQYRKGNIPGLDRTTMAALEYAKAHDRIQFAFNTYFFTRGDSKLPAVAGIWAAAVGSFYLLLLVFVFSFPVGVMTAVYLEEFAPDNRFTQAIEVNINNLAAVPSIIFGLLGLAVFINFFGAPRSSALVGGLTIGLMTLPVIIISTRAALRAVPDPIRLGAFAIGASRWQVVRDHVLPMSLPGILTGTIIGLAQAMGETAPLILVGMIAYIPQAPSGILDAATVLPAQIFTWFAMPEQAYVERTAAAIIVLLALLLAMNAAAVWLRRRFERRS